MVVTVHPPALFGIVEEGVYRSQAPVEENLPFLAGLKLRTVIFLSPEVLIRGVVDWMHENNIQLSNLGLQFWKPDPSWTPLCDDLVKASLEMVLDVRNHPILLCCASGVYQTAPLVGCLRRVQNWNLTAVLDEYRAFAGGRARLVHEQYAELFDTDLITVPQHAPAWFVDYNLIDPRLEMVEKEALEAQLRSAEAIPEDQRTQEDGLLLRRCMFELRLMEQAWSSMLVSPGVAFSKQSILDDEDDD
uniref:Tyrosine-protein phosphatase domain-containing protein n=1 Tax=Hemiselmis andersenii TaxID=464988 RepID=A0A6T8KQE8_HEMAN|mmetsp:Transcript_32358/g.78879  ORF Transcript_32358/g.78879 Transcript_32358/m.78879 type:complete len:246 (+) Transcript_32358:60-797(+)